MYADFCKMLGIKYPIIQGAMAWISNASLVSAVSEAGGIGIIATGHLDAEGCRAEIKKVREVTDKPFGVNIMLLSQFADDIAKVIVEEKVPLVTTGAGSPAKYMKEWKAAGVTVIPVVPSVAMAKMMERDGADAVIAEGCESGGHVGKTTTMALVPQVVDAVNIPVIAAGGIADGRGMAAATMLGASGFQIGTRFLVAKECTVHQNYKNKILKAKDIDTTTTGEHKGHPVRVIRNRLTRAYDEALKNNAPSEEFTRLTKGSLQRAVIDGDVDFGSVMSGQIAGLVKKEQTAAEILEDLYTDYTRVLESYHKA